MEEEDEEELNDDEEYPLGKTNNLKIFFSYAEKDLKYFNIRELAEFLQQQPEIGAVYFWGFSCGAGQSIMEYMTSSIKEADVVLVFYSKNAHESAAVNQELGMAAVLNKRIIPVFLENLRDWGIDLPPILRDKRGLIMGAGQFIATYDLLEKEGTDPKEIEELKNEFGYNEYSKIYRNIFNFITGKDVEKLRKKPSIMELIRLAKERVFYGPIQFKILLLGAGASGKSTFLYRLLSGSFDENTKMTQGVEFVPIDVKYDGVDIRLEFWDFGGQERYRWMQQRYCSDADGGILFFDLVRVMPLNDLPSFESMARSQNIHLPILFVGTKMDAIEDTCVPDYYIDELITRYNLFDFVKISSKTGEGIEKMIQRIIAKILETKYINLDDYRGKTTCPNCGNPIQYYSPQCQKCNTYFEWQP